MTPRIPPLGPDERDDETQQLLSTFHSPDGAELNIFATLARHPRLLKRWGAFGGTLLYRGRLEGRDRELLILRTGYLCRAGYEWGQHVGIARSVGLSEEEIARVASGPEADGWSSEDADLLRSVDELHHNSRISEPTWASLAARYDAQQLIEICMVVGQYHLVSFTLNSLDVEPESADLPELPEAGKP